MKMVYHSTLYGIPYVIWYTILHCNMVYHIEIAGCYGIITM
jgi:hypothetical protein